MSTTTVPQSPLTAEDEKQLKQRLIDVRIANEKYLREHPEVGQVLGEVTRQVLLRRPDEPVAFAEDFLATSDLHAVLRELHDRERAAHGINPAGGAATRGSGPAAAPAAPSASSAQPLPKAKTTSAAAAEPASTTAPTAAAPAGPGTVSYEVLARQDDQTSTAVCAALKEDAAFKALSASEGNMIIQRDKEDEEKLGLGIQHAVKKGVLPADSGAGEVIKISVVGRTAESVAKELMNKLGATEEGRGTVIVLQGLSGTGKGTTVGKLSQWLKSCVTWSNGNVFRSVTYLVSEHCEATGIEFSADVLSAELLAATMKRISFERFGDEFDVVLDGKTRVSTIANTLLKAPTISSRVPTVAGATQGEVVLFAADAVKTLTEAGRNVILEGRAQTLNYISTPNRFELVIEDPALLGQRRAAQRVMAEAQANANPGQSAGEVTAALQCAATKLAP